MWAAVRQRFRAFHQDLNLTPTQAEDGTTKATGIARSLTRAYYPDRPDNATLPAFLVGSWGKSTQVRPPNGVDMMFEIPAVDFDRINGRVGNKQSALLQEVKGVLGDTYTQTTMRGDGQVVQVQFNTLMVEVVPVARIPGDQFYMPDTNGGGQWKTVDPFAEQRRIESLDRDCNGNMRTMCQMLKVWKRENNVPLKSFQIELLVQEFMNTYQFRLHDYFYFDWFMRDFFAFLIRKAGNCVFAPGTNEIIWLGDEWKTRAETAFRNALEACSYEYNDSENLAGLEWQKVFGNRIPMSVL